MLIRCIENFDGDCSFGFIRTDDITSWRLCQSSVSERLWLIQGLSISNEMWVDIIRLEDMDDEQAQLEFVEYVDNVQEFDIYREPIEKGEERTRAELLKERIKEEQASWAKKIMHFDPDKKIEAMKNDRAKWVKEINDFFDRAEIIQDTLNHNQDPDKKMEAIDNFLDRAVSKENRRDWDRIAKEIEDDI